MSEIGQVIKQPSDRMRGTHLGNGAARGDHTPSVTLGKSSLCKERPAEMRSSHNIRRSRPQIGRYRSTQAIHKAPAYAHIQ